MYFLWLCSCTSLSPIRKPKIKTTIIAKELQKENFPIRLLLAGDGADRKELENMIRENQLENTVFLLGNREPILPFLSIADLYVSASRSEGLPFNIMEAMSCGLPILASDTKGQIDLLKEFPGTLYPADDLDALVNAIKQSHQKGDYGVGSNRYSNLEQYRLTEVFEDNMKLFSASLTQERNQV